MVYPYEADGGIGKMVANQLVLGRSGEWILPFWREMGGQNCSQNHGEHGKAGVLISYDKVCFRDLLAVLEVTLVNAKFLMFRKLHLKLWSSQFTRKIDCCKALGLTQACSSHNAGIIAKKQRLCRAKFESEGWIGKQGQTWDVKEVPLSEGSPPTWLIEAAIARKRQLLIQALHFKQSQSPCT